MSTNSLPNGGLPLKMSEAGYLLDASAVLAMMFEEAGAERVAQCLPTAQISAVNLSEVIAKLHDNGMSPDKIALNLADLKAVVIPFDQKLALRAGALRPSTRHLGLSLGDRACLATAEAHGLAVLTADKAWAKLDLDIPVELLR